MRVSSPTGLTCEGNINFLPKVDFLAQFGGVWLFSLVFAAPGYKSMVNWTAIIFFFTFQKMDFCALYF